MLEEETEIAMTKPNHLKFANQRNGGKAAVAAPRPPPQSKMISVQTRLSLKLALLQGELACR